MIRPGGGVMRRVLRINTMNSLLDTSRGLNHEAGLFITGMLIAGLNVNSSI